MGFATYALQRHADNSIPIESNSGRFSTPVRKTDVTGGFNIFSLPFSARLPDLNDEQDCDEEAKNIKDDFKKSIQIIASLFHDSLLLQRWSKTHATDRS